LAALLTVQRAEAAEVGWSEGRDLPDPVRVREYEMGRHPGLTWDREVELEVSVSQASAVKIARCRDMCLDEYLVLWPRTRCPGREGRLFPQCHTCWNKCASLHHTLRDAEATACSRIPDCESEGCQRACQFHMSPPATPPSPNPRPPTSEMTEDSALELRLVGFEPRRPMLQTDFFDPPGDVLAVGFARIYDGRIERVQTPEDVAVVEADDVAVEAAVEAAGDTAEDAAGVAEFKKIEERWGLHTVSVAEDDNMVLAEITWKDQGVYGVDYFVTWEVSGGGIKGHLYTDRTTVTLSLWPDAVYLIQVEVMEVEVRPGSWGQEFYGTSPPLEISTYLPDIQVAALSLPMSPAAQAALIAIGLLTLLLAVAALAVCLAPCGGSGDEKEVSNADDMITSSGSHKDAPRGVMVVSKSVKQKSVASPLENVGVCECSVRPCWKELSVTV